MVKIKQFMQPEKDYPKRSFRQELTARWTMSEIARAAIVGSLQVALCMVVAPLAYGPIQFRIGSMLGMVPFDRKYGGRGPAVGMVIGGVVIALFSPFGIMDLALGIVSGIVCVSVVWWLGIRTRGSDIGKVIAGVSEALITAFFIGYILLYRIFQCPLTESLAGVFAGEMACCLGLGFALLKGLERIYKRKV